MPGGSGWAGAPSWSDELPGVAGAPSGSSCGDQPDRPDSDFEDSNCDGIDGDRARALFVSPLGDDEAEGTPEAPLASLRRGIQRGQAEGRDVYVCSATYQENLEVVGGVRLFGGFSCQQDWQRTERPAVVAPRSGLPFRLRDVGEAGAIVREFEFVSANATAPGTSSIAASVLRAKKVSFDHVGFHAGSGADAPPALTPRVHGEAAGVGRPGGSSPHQQSALTGESCFTPGGTYCDGQICDVEPPVLRPECAARQRAIARAWRCTAEHGCLGSCETDGGKFVSTVRSMGGDGGNLFVAFDARAGERVPDTRNAGLEGAVGERAIEGFGHIDSAGDYIADNRGSLGGFGGIGRPGKGGDGGVGYIPRAFDTDPFLGRIGGAGGTSGFPGCGGFPGNPGEAGGASLGLVVVDSEVALERVSIRTASGGVGGSPTEGSAGQLGGAGGAGGKSSIGTPGADGQQGGTGGPGGPGGPGGGGPSVGIVAVGAAPTQRAVRFELGEGGQGGRALRGTGVGDGQRGVSQDLVSIVKETK
ncbi:MAG TPA: hypothetical protein VLC09_11465 [Polyangiaceae bacterium]|nr:hypothetical protein [Polyangiaceae bacterium]